MAALNAGGRGRDGARLHATRLLARRALAAEAFEILLERPAGFDFVAGQRLRIEHAEFARDYTLASAPDDAALALCLRRVPGGRATSWLAGLEIGAPLEISGPHGYFTWRGSERPTVWIATGTGIAPFVAMARAGARGFTLLHGVRRPAELYYREVLERAAARYVPCLSGAGDAGRAREVFFAGRVTAYAAARLAPGCYDFYLCGRSEMIRDVIALIDERFPESRVFSEAFF